MNYRYTFLLLVILISGFQPLKGQEISQITKQKPLQLSSGISLAYGLYQTNSADERQSPTNWVLTGSPTVAVYGISFPFSFVISNQQRSTQQPFNRFGLTPTYKWVKTYLGWSSMNFSQYTLAGRQFLGAGVELTPKGLRLGAMYGRFQKAIREDSLAVNSGTSYISEIPNPAFSRKGYAFKLGFGVASNHIDFTYMKAKDDPGSIPQPVKTSVLPQENAGLGITWQFTFFKKISWKLDAGLSAFTRDVHADTIDLEDVPFRSVIQKVILPTQTTQGFLGGETSIGFRQKQFAIELKYKRIDPGFRSMGAYYFQTDVEQYTLVPSFPIGKTLQVSGSIGLMQDNLYKKKIATTKRFISNGNISYNKPGGIFGVDLNYSNFGITQSPGLHSLADSTRIQQVNQSINFSPHFNITKPSKTQSWFLLLGVNQLADRNPNIIYKSNSSAIVSNVGYSVSFIKPILSISGNLAFNSVKTTSGSTRSYGLNFGGSKGFYAGKLNANFNSGWFTNFFNGKNNGHSLSSGVSGSYAISKKQSATLSGNMIQNQSRDAQASPSFREFFGNIAYSLYF